MTYREGGCTANCAFCPQARESKANKNLLSRIIWPPRKLEIVAKAVSKAFENKLIKRICIQAVNYPKVYEDIKNIVKVLLSEIEMPISVSCQPLNRWQMEELKSMGIERVSVALDAATKTLFEKWKGIGVSGPYNWETHWRALRDAVEIFGWNKTTTHIIVGLGEKEEDVIKLMQSCVDSGINPALFAFTPIKGTKLENLKQPSLQSYRIIQLARYLIIHGEARYEDMSFSNGVLTDFGVDQRKLIELAKNGEAFMTSGCPNCNRPFYNERVRGLIYNYPRPLSRREALEAIKVVLERLNT